MLLLNKKIRANGLIPLFPFVILDEPVCYRQQIFNVDWQHSHIGPMQKNLDQFCLDTGLKRLLRIIYVQQKTSLMDCKLKNSE